MTSMGFITVIVQEGTRQPLPVGPPIGGPVWTVVVPAILLVGASVGTWLLYRHFAGSGHSDEEPG